MLTLSVVIVPNQNWSPDHTIQSELLGFLTPVFWSILTQHLSGTNKPKLIVVVVPRSSNQTWRVFYLTSWVNLLKVGLI